MRGGSGYKIYRNEIWKRNCENINFRISSLWEMIAAIIFFFKKWLTYANKDYMLSILGPRTIIYILKELTL